jgi:hypothetical protein
MIVLVCGGRDYFGAAALNRMREVLNALHENTPINLLIHGEAYGADSLAGVWAAGARVPVRSFPISETMIKAYGKGAGHLRNKEMLRQGHPNLVIAFPGGPGTADMVQRRTALVCVLLR